MARNKTPAGFHDSWRTVRGLRLHALESVGSASPWTLLLPGLVTASRSMVPLGRALTARGVAVRILDLPGFGYSDKPRWSLSVSEQAAVVAEWLAATGHGPVNLLGNSFGSQVAAMIAADHPDTAARLILLSPAMSPAVRQRLSWLRAMPGAQAPASSRQQNRWRARLLARMHDALGEQPPLRVLNVAEYACASLPRAVGTLRTATLDPVEPIMPRIGVPVLIIRAEHDRLSSAEWVARLAGLAPGIRVVQLPGAGHDVFHRAADAVAEAAAPFLVSGPGSEVAPAQ